MGSLAIFVSKAFLSWNRESANVNTLFALLLNVMKPKWSASGEGLNLPTNFSRNVITSLRLGIRTLFDLSRTIPMSSPAVQGGAKGNEKQLVQECLRFVTIIIIDEKFGLI